MYKNRPIWLIQAPVARELSPVIESKFTPSPPLGILALATYLEDHGFEVYASDLIATPITQREFVGRLEEMNPAVLGLGVYSATCEGAKTVAMTAKNIVPDLTVVFGGPHSTFTYEEIIEYPNVNFVVLGEGEITLLELCKRLYSNSGVDFSDISGLAFKGAHGLVVTSPRSLIPTLDDLPIIRREFLDLGQYVLPFNIITSRGCFGRCTFCVTTSFWQNKCRYRSVASLENELDYLWAKYNIVDLVVADSTFTANVPRLKDFCDMLRRKERSIRWSCNSRIDMCKTEMFREMYEAGCRKIMFGVESGDDRILKSIGKNITCEQIRQTVKDAVEAGLGCVCSFMLGHPEDTLETVRRTIALIKHVKEERGCNVIISMNTPYPGSPQYENVKLLGLKVYRRSWDDYATPPIVTETKYLSKDVITALSNWRTEFLSGETTSYDPV